MNSTAEMYITENGNLYAGSADLTEKEREAFELEVDAREIKEHPENMNKICMYDNNSLKRIKETDTPKNIQTGYKLFKVENGMLYPPSDGATVDTPMGFWLEAKESPLVSSGWHISDIPYAPEFLEKNVTTGKKEFPANYVWAEVEYSADNNYDNNHPEGSELPKDGYYSVKKNDSTNSVWFVADKMRVKRIVDFDEVEIELNNKGIEAPKIAHIYTIDRRMDLRKQAIHHVFDTMFNNINETPATFMQTVRDASARADLNKYVGERYWRTCINDAANSGGKFWQDSYTRSEILRKNGFDIKNIENVDNAWSKMLYEYMKDLNILRGPQEFKYTLKQFGEDVKNHFCENVENNAKKFPGITAEEAWEKSAKHVFSNLNSTQKLNFMRDSRVKTNEKKVEDTRGL